MYECYQEQILHTSAKELWQFVSRPENLNDITPEELNFTIISDVPEKMYNGLLVEYKVKLPLLGTSDWVTEIKHIIPQQQFVDEQRLGPYKFWYHQHQLEEIDDGIKMIDHVRYQPPYGVLGKVANKLLIQQKLRSIFDYRKKILAKRYD